MRVSQSPSVILHQRPYRETSLLLEIFSRGQGRVSLVARGMRSGRKKSQGLIQLHRKLNLSWSGRGEMGTLTDIEAGDSGFNLRGRTVVAVFYLNELLMRLLHRHEAHPELFDSYLKTLTRLEHGVSELIALRYFEKQLLDSLGYGLVLDHDVETGDSIQEGKVYYYLIDRGPTANTPSDNNYVEVTGDALLALDREQFQQGSPLVEIKQLMRVTLNGYLGAKPLASRDLYRAYADQLIKDQSASG